MARRGDRPRPHHRVPPSADCVQAQRQGVAQGDCKGEEGGGEGARKGGEGARVVCKRQGARPRGIRRVDCREAREGAGEARAAFGGR